MKTKKARPPKKPPKLYTGPQVAALMALARKTAYAKGRAECSNDHITVTAAIGDTEPGRVYCLVRAVPLEPTQPTTPLGFGA